MKLFVPALFLELFLATMASPQTTSRNLPERPKTEECGISGMVVKLAGSEPLKTATVQLQSLQDLAQDRKSTRLNSSHSQISYAVFCLKKKKVMRILHTFRHVIS